MESLTVSDTLPRDLEGVAERLRLAREHGGFFKYAMFASENGLGPTAFPSLAQMEREVVGFGLSLLNAPAGAAGAMTSGGTDSILMALKAARTHARTALGKTI